MFQVIDEGVQQVGRPSEVILGQQGDPYRPSIYSEAPTCIQAYRNSYFELW